MQRVFVACVCVCYAACEGGSMSAGSSGRTIGAPQYVEPQRDDYVYQVALRRVARASIGRGRRAAPSLPTYSLADDSTKTWVEGSTLKGIAPDSNREVDKPNSPHKHKLPGAQQTCFWKSMALWTTPLDSTRAPTRSTISTITPRPTAQRRNAPEGHRSGHALSPRTRTVPPHASEL